MTEHNSADSDARCFAEWNDSNSVRVHICTKQGAHTTHRCGACGETVNKVIASAEGDECCCDRVRDRPLICPVHGSYRTAIIPSAEDHA